MLLILFLLAEAWALPLPVAAGGSDPVTQCLHVCVPEIKSHGWCDFVCGMLTSPPVPGATDSAAVECTDCQSCCELRATVERTQFPFCSRMCSTTPTTATLDGSLHANSAWNGLVDFTDPVDSFVSVSLPAMQQVSITLHYEVSNANTSMRVPLAGFAWQIGVEQDTGYLAPGSDGKPSLPLPKPASTFFLNVSDGELILTVRHNSADQFPFVLSVSATGSPVLFYVTVSPIIPVSPQVQYFTHSTSTIPPSAYFNLSHVTTGNKLFNNAQRDVDCVYIVALQVEMDADFVAHYFPFPSLYIEQLTILADTVIISAPLILPSTEVLIQARRVEFRANGEIDTTPAGFTMKPGIGGKGQGGANAPAIRIFTGEPIDISQSQRAAVPLPLLASNGGTGQEGGPGVQGSKGLSVGTFPGNSYCGGWIPFDDVTFHSYYDSHKGKCAHLNWHTGNDEHGSRQCPGNGGDSVQAGRSGDGGIGGNITMSFPLTASLVSVVGGTSPARGAAVPGGDPGTPRTARWVMCGAYRANPGRGDWWFNTQSSCVGCPGCPGNPCPTTQPGRAVPEGEQGNTGSDGAVNVMDSTFLTPSLLRLVCDYISALHYENSIDRMQKMLDLYLPVIRRAVEQQSGEMDWAAVFLALLESHQHRIRAGLDFYNHQWGYVPIYPLEISTTIFTQEVYANIRLLYLVHYLRTLSGQEQQAVAAMSSMISQLVLQVQSQASQLSDLEVSLPRLQATFNQLQFEENDMKTQIARVEKYLEDLARDNVKRRHEVPAWKRALKFASAVLPLIPIGQPALATIGGFAGSTLSDALDVANGDQSLDSLITSIPTSYDTYSKAVGDQTLSKSITGLKDTLKGIDLGSKESYVKTLPGMYTQMKGIGKTVRGLTDLLKQNSVDKDEVQREFEQLEANDQELQDMKQKLIDLVNLKASAWECVQEAVQQIAALPTQITQGIQSIDEMNHKITSTGNYVRDAAVMSLLESWLSDAEERLQYWQYIVARAYEFRLAQPFPTSSSIQLVRDQILLEISKNNNSPVLSDDSVKTIALPYTQALRRTMQDVGKWLRQDKRKKKLINFSRFLPDINALVNSDVPLAIDLAQLGIVPFTDRVAVIADVVVTITLDPNYVPHDLTDTPVITIAHGIDSTLHNNRQLFGFTHVPSETPQYTCRYDFNAKQCVMDKPSPLQQSLLYFLVCPPDTATDCPDLDRLVQYVQPAFWTTLYVTYEDDGVERPPVVQAMSVEITYDSSVSDECYVRVVPAGGYNSPLYLIQSSDSPGDTDAAYGEFIRFFTCFSTISIESEVISSQFVFDSWQVPSGAPPVKHPTPSRLDFTLTKSVTVTSLHRPRFAGSDPAQPLEPIRSAFVRAGQKADNGTWVAASFPSRVV